MEPPRCRYVQEIRAAGRELKRSLRTQFVRGLQNRIAFQFGLPAQARLRALGGSERPPGDLSVRIAPRLPQVVPQFISYERPIHEIRRMPSHRVGDHPGEFILWMEECEQCRSVSVHERHIFGIAFPARSG